MYHRAEKSNLGSVLFWDIIKKRGEVHLNPWKEHLNQQFAPKTSKFAPKWVEGVT